MSPVAPVIDLADDSTPPPPTKRQPNPLRESNVNGRTIIDLCLDDDEDPLPSTSSKKPNSQPKSSTPRNVKPNNGTASSIVSKSPSRQTSASASKPTASPRRRSDPFWKQPSRSSGSTLENVATSASPKSRNTPMVSSKSTPPKPSNTPPVFPNTSDAPIKHSSHHPYGFPLENHRPSSTVSRPFRYNAEDDVPDLKEPTRSPVAPSLREPSGERRPESRKSVGSSRRASSSSRVTGNEISSGKPADASPPAQQQPVHEDLPDNLTSSSNNEKDSSSGNDAEETPIEPLMHNDNIQSLSDSTPKTSPRSNARSRRSIPDSVGSSSTILRRLRESRLEQQSNNTRPHLNSHRRDESPRDVMARRLSKEKEIEEDSPEAHKTHTIASLEKSLRAFEQQIQEMDAVVTRNLLRENKEAVDLRNPLIPDDVDFFKSMQCIQLPSTTPIPKEAFSEKVEAFVAKTANTNKLFRSRTFIVAKTIKSNIPRVPKFDSSYYVSRNILSADDEMLRYVPYLGDVDSKESNKRRLEKDLADAYTTEHNEPSRDAEKLVSLGAHLDEWLEHLNIGCSRETLEHFVMSREKIMREVGLGNENRNTLLKVFSAPLSINNRTMADYFMQAFEKVFGISLGKVLLRPDRLKELMGAAKASNRKNSDNAHTSLETHLETHVALQCLICYAIDCQTHGIYQKDSDDETEQATKKHISMPPRDLIRLYQKRLGEQAKQKDLANIGDNMDTLGEPCGEDCFQLVDTGVMRYSYEFSQKNTEELRHILFAWEEKDSRSCDIAMGMEDVPCWQVYIEIQKIELEPVVRTPEGSPALRVKRSVPNWYDNKKKELKHGFKDMTGAHLHQDRSQINPCAHPGRPCDSECPCVRADVLCERMCNCLHDCPYRFTGCSCSSNGRSCSSDSCICIQMNRECGKHCVKCGAVERLDPLNKYNETLFATSCQNVAISRGVSKQLILGESQLEGTGFGLYAAEPIRKSEFVSEYGGEIISTDEAERRGIVYDRKYLSFLFDLNGDWAIDAAHKGNKTRFINHADSERDGLNCEAKIMFVDGEHRIKFIALRDIAAGEELLFNYGKKFAQKHALNQKLPKIKEGSKKGVVVEAALNALDGVDSRKRTNVRGNMTGMHGRHRRGGRGRGGGRGRARKTAPGREAVKKRESEPEPEVKTEDEEIPDVVDNDAEEYGDFEDDDEQQDSRPTRRRKVPLRYTR